MSGVQKMKLSFLDIRVSTGTCLNACWSEFIVAGKLCEKDT